MSSGSGMAEMAVSLESLAFKGFGSGQKLISTQNITFLNTSIITKIMKDLYIINSDLRVLEWLLVSVGQIYHHKERYKLLQERCSVVNPNFGMPYIRLEPWGISKRIDLDYGENIGLTTKATGKQINDYLLGFIEEEPSVDTLIWFKCKGGYDWSKTFQALKREYNLKFGDLILSPEETRTFGAKKPMFFLKG